MMNQKSPHVLNNEPQKAMEIVDKQEKIIHREEIHTPASKMIPTPQPHPIAFSQISQIRVQSETEKIQNKPKISFDKCQNSRIMLVVNDDRRTEMPRGVPKAGFRMTKKRKQAQAAGNMPALNNNDLPPVIKTNETDEEIAQRITERFDILEDLAYAAFDGTVKSLITSGPAGLGKTYTVEDQVAKIVDPDKKRHAVVKGYVRATGLFKTLWNNKEDGDVIIFDDADSIFFDDVSLNILKAVCDTTEERNVSYMSEAELTGEDGSVIPKTFEFRGTIIFITNLDFDQLISKGHKLAPHLLALISRSHYIDLAMKSQRDYFVRIKQVIGKIMAQKNYGPEIEADTIEFIEDNLDTLRELSLRMVIKIAGIRASKTKDWKKMATVTCCRNS